MTDIYVGRPYAITDEPIEAPSTDTPAPPAPQAEAITDERPVLASTDPIFGDPEDGDLLDGMPPLRDLRRMLPSARMRVQMDLAAAATGIPEAMVGGEFDMEDLTPELADAIAGFFERMEGLVLDNAEDRDAMASWLIASDRPTEALQSAFGVLAERLGN